MNLLFCVFMTHIIHPSSHHCRGQELGSQKCMFGHKVDFFTGQVVDSNRKRTPQDYKVTCMQSEEDAKALSQYNEQKPVTTSTMTLEGLEIWSQPRVPCRTSGSWCTSDTDCCIGFLCSINESYEYDPENPYSMFGWKSCQQDPAYRFRDEGEVRFRLLLYL